MREVLGRDSGARVRDREARLALLDRDLETDPALFGELDRVAQEVGEHLQNPVAVAVHERPRPGQLRLERDAFLRGERLHGEQRVLGQRARVAAGPSDAEAAGIDSRDVEQIVDQPAHRVRLALQPADEIARKRGVLRQLVRQG